jgi:hypothetical protein
VNEKSYSDTNDLDHKVNIARLIRSKKQRMTSMKPVTLHALLRCFLQIIWRSNEPQVSMLGV